MAEGRFERWSRLKRKGGAEDRDESRTEEARDRRGSAAPTVDALPGGRIARHVVPPMPPLAGDAEDDDDRLTRGVGHEATAEEVAGEREGARLPEPTHPGVAADGLAEQAAAQNLFAGIDERELTEEEQAAVADLPPVESLTKESDFTPFLQAGVPDFIKRKALRVLWRSDPFFNFRDGMNEYDEDYNVIHRVITELTGNYQVGRGHLSEEELRKMTPERARKAFGMDDDEEAAEEESEAAATDSRSETETISPADDPETRPESDEMADAEADVGEGEDEPRG